MTGIADGKRTLLEDLDHWASHQPEAPWLVEHWTTRQTDITWRDGVDSVRSAAAWIADRVARQGGDTGTRIGLLSRNCAHWVLADLAIMASGHVTVPLFTSMSPEIIEFVADFAEIELLLLGPAENWGSVRDTFSGNLPIVRLPDAPDVPGAIDWSDVVADGSMLRAPDPIDPNALATIVFTSGTTGRPKGVMHSLTSLKEAGYGVGVETGATSHSRFLSYLPLAHLGERVVVEFNAVPFGSSIYFNESLETFLDDLRHTKPTWFLGVPRIWEKLQQAVYAYVASPEDIAAAARRGELDRLGRKVQEFLGLEEADYILTSTAPTPAPLKAWYDDIGIALHDGYGQSEILPISISRKGRRKAGTIGEAAHGVEIRIADDGEILSRAPGTALGYYKQPELTAETFLEDGFVRTGDRGFLDDDGHLHITGRVKEIFKTARGKYVAPAPIEGVFLDTSLVEQACLTGDGLAQTVIVAVLAEPALQRPREEVHAELLNHVEAINADQEKHQRIGAVIVSRTPWSQDNHMLTHTFKMRRDQVEHWYADQIAEAGERMRNGEALFVIDPE